MKTITSTDPEVVEVILMLSASTHRVELLVGPWFVTRKRSTLRAGGHLTPRLTQSQARTLLTSLAVGEAAKRDITDYALAMRLSSQPVTESLSSRFVDGQLRMCVYFDDDSSRQLVQVTSTDARAWCHLCTSTPRYAVHAPLIR